MTLAYKGILAALHYTLQQFHRFTLLWPVFRAFPLTALTLQMPPNAHTNASFPYPVLGK